MDILTAARNMLMEKGIPDGYIRFLNLTSKETLEKSIKEVENQYRSDTDRLSMTIKAIEECSRNKF